MQNNVQIGAQGAVRSAVADSLAGVEISSAMLCCIRGVITGVGTGGPDDPAAVLRMSMKSGIGFG